MLKSGACCTAALLLAVGASVLVSDAGKGSAESALPALPGAEMCCISLAAGGVLAASGSAMFAPEGVGD